VLPKPLQNSPKTTSADTTIFSLHQQPPFTSKNSHHVVPLIPTRCTQNSSQTIPKTAPFFPKNSTSFISKTTPLYLQNSTETTMKMPQKQCKKCPVDTTAVAPHPSTAFIVVACYLSPPPAPCPSPPLPSCLHSMCPQTLMSFWLVGVLSAPHLLEVAPQFSTIPKMPLATS